MKLALALLILMGFAGCNKPDDEIDEGSEIVQGFVLLTTQAEVDAFGSKGYTTIKKDLIINEKSACSITDLSPLSKITHVGKLQIFGNQCLQSLVGLNNLVDVGELLEVSSNPELVDLTGLESITRVEGNVAFYNNQKMESFTGLSNLNRAKFLTIVENPSIKSLEGLGSLSSVELLWVKSNEKMVSLLGTRNITTLQILEISNNTLLSNLELGLLRCEVIKIENNSALTNLNGLDGLRIVQNLFIDSNQNLETLDGVENLEEILELHVINNDKLLNFEPFSFTSLEVLKIWNNDALNSLAGLESLSAPIKFINIKSNPLLTTLKELENIPSLTPKGTSPFIPRIDILDNSELVDFCSLLSIVNTLPDEPEMVSVLIENNGFNPSIDSIAAGLCASE